MPGQETSWVESAISVLCALGNSPVEPDVFSMNMNVVMDYLREQNYSDSSLELLSGLPDRVKVLVIQQYFEHTQVGTHKTTYDEAVVTRLLKIWFRVDIEGESGVLQTGAQRSFMQKFIDEQEVKKVSFGGTDIFLCTSKEKYDSTRDLLDVVKNRAVLTTDATSPPCAISEFVPRWLVQQGREIGDYYLEDESEDPIEDYFSRQIDHVREKFGVEIQQPSKEMALIANGDGLRYHRDRLVNQYRYLESLGEKSSEYRLVQELTLFDWDMQVGTVSGTAVDHPNGDRYLFVLQPGEVLPIFFSEKPMFPGPMMMPYHCALPVIDRAATKTVGVAKGKRVSTLVRGISHEQEICSLAARSTQIQINDVVWEEAEKKMYSNGIRTTKTTVSTVLAPVAVLAVEEEAVSITELSSEQNRDLLESVLRGNSEGARIFRVEKYSDGFSDLEVIPGFSMAEEVHIVNRCRQVSQDNSSFPVSLDFLDRGLPWFHMCAGGAGSIIDVPRSERSLVRLTPPIEILHRSALLDSFHAKGEAKERMSTTVDVIIH